MHKKEKHTALGRRPYTVNQKSVRFADSRLHRNADGPARAIAEQLEDLDMYADTIESHEVVTRANYDVDGNVTSIKVLHAPKIAWFSRELLSFHNQFLEFSGTSLTIHAIDGDLIYDGAYDSGIQGRESLLNVWAGVKRG